MATLSISLNGMPMARPTSRSERASGHGAEGRDLRNAIVAVLADDVADDFVATVVGEVDVDVREREAVGIEESLEDQAVLEWIERGNRRGNT